MRKLISVMLILAALFVTGCGKKEEKQEIKTDAPEVKQEQKAEPAKKEQPKEEKKEEQPQEQSSQPAKLETNGEDLEEMINKFNELEDGDPEKEELRTKLEQIFASVE